MTLPITTYILGALPAVIFSFYMLTMLPFSGFFLSIIAPFVLFFSFVLFLLGEIFIPAILIKLFNIKT